jgi:hypothetical protein
MRLRAPFNKERQAMSEPPKKVEKQGENRQFKAGIAVGIGSAAIVAALLYARSGKPKKK